MILLSYPMIKYIITDNRYGNINLVTDELGVTKEYNSKEDAVEDLEEYPDGIIIGLE